MALAGELSWGVAEKGVRLHQPGRRMLTAREVATELEMSEAWVRKGCQDGSIPAIRVGRQGSWRIARAWVERVLNGTQSGLVVTMRRSADGSKRPVLSLDDDRRDV